MAKETTNIRQEDDDGSDSSKGRKPHLKGKFPPRESLANCEAYVKDAYKLGGTSNSFDVLVKAVKTGSASGGTFGVRIYTPQNFGFWTINARDKSYNINSLGIQLLNPDGPNARIAALQEGFAKIPLLKAIWDQFRGMTLPADEFFPNAIIKCGVPEELKSGWAEYFIESAKYAGIMDEKRYVRVSPINNTLRNSPQPQQNEVQVPTPEVKIEKPDSTQRQIPEIQVPKENSLGNFLAGFRGDITRKTISGGREVLFLVPEELTRKDINQITILLKSIETGLEGYLVDDDRQG